MRKTFAVGVMAAIAASAFGSGVASAAPSDGKWVSYSFQTRNECETARKAERRETRGCYYTQTTNGNDWSYSVQANRVQR